jgi:alpha-1,3-fucosyltransferase
MTRKIPNQWMIPAMMVSFVLKHRLRLFLLCLVVMLLLRRDITTYTSAVSSSQPTTTVTTSTTTAKAVKNNNSNNTKKERIIKYILYYNSYWGKDDFQFGIGRKPFVDYQCPETRCFAQPATIPTQHRVANNSQYDAVLISAHAQDFHFGERLKDIKSWRKPHQRFVFVNMESQAYNIQNLEAMRSFFNWTMTFKWNSDIPRPYGWFQPNESVSESSSAAAPHFASRPPTEWKPYNEQEFLSTTLANHRDDERFHALARRPGKVAWIVSHCATESLREEYVSKLRQYIPVDQFGTCGPTTRGGGPTSTCDIKYSITEPDNCTRYVEQNYKFYLAFENQLCNDYVTEKFFRRMENMIVITLGQANYTAIAPPHSSLNVFDFATPKALADYLHQLDQNDAQYLSYFWWKDHYQVHHPGGSSSTSSTSTSSTLNNFGHAMCQLCSKLHDEKEPPKVYEDLYGWWRGDAECGTKLPGLKARMYGNLNTYGSSPGVRPKMPGLKAPMYGTINKYNSPGV